MRSFEEINELLDKVGERLERTERIVNANNDGYAEIKKILKEVGRKLDKTASVVDGIGDSNGIIAEEFFMETTKEGLHIDAFGHLEQKTCNYIIYDSDKNKRAEFDIVFTNDDFIFIVEVKYRLDKKQLSFFTKKKENGIDKGLNRLEIFKKYDEKWIGNRAIVTAFACLGAKKKVIETFKEKGHYVLVREPNDTYKLFSPR